MLRGRQRKSHCHIVAHVTQPGHPFLLDDDPRHLRSRQAGPPHFILSPHDASARGRSIRVHAISSGISAAAQDRTPQEHIPPRQNQRKIPSNHQPPLTSKSKKLWKFFDSCWHEHQQHFKIFDPPLLIQSLLLPLPTFSLGA